MSAALTPIIPMSREEIIYLDFFFFCRRLRIRPVPFGRWLRLSEGRDWYEEEGAEATYGPLGPVQPTPIMYI